jgi:uncharacterized OB-fold protein
MSDDEPPFRILPRVTELNAHFWQGGREGKLQFQRCAVCRYWMHPYGVLCPRCHAKELTYEAVSGTGELHAYTINHQAWMPGPELPFVVAIVELPEQEALRLTTNLVNCDLDDLHIGMPVRVLFEAHPDEEVWIPLFEPAP